MERRNFMSMLGAFFGALVFGGKVPELTASLISISPDMGEYRCLQMEILMASKSRQAL